MYSHQFSQPFPLLPSAMLSVLDMLRWVAFSPFYDGLPLMGDTGDANLAVATEATLPVHSPLAMEPPNVTTINNSVVTQHDAIHHHHSPSAQLAAAGDSLNSHHHTQPINQQWLHMASHANQHYPAAFHSYLSASHVHEAQLSNANKHLPDTAAETIALGLAEPVAALPVTLPPLIAANGLTAHHSQHLAPVHSLLLQQYGGNAATWGLNSYNAWLQVGAVANAKQAGDDHLHAAMPLLRPLLPLARLPAMFTATEDADAAIFADADDSHLMARETTQNRYNSREHRNINLQLNRPMIEQLTIHAGAANSSSDLDDLRSSIENILLDIINHANEL